MGSLQSHEQRINRSSKKSIEQAFQARGNIFKDKSGSSHEESQNTSGRGRGRGQTYSGGKGRGRYFSTNNKGRGNDDSDEGKRFNKSQVQCFYCKIFGHYERNCWKKQKQQANFSDEKEEVGTLFLACDSTNNVSKEVWLMDSGCSNHMRGNKDGFVQIDESTKSDVLLGDDKPVEAKGKGTIVVKTKQGKPKHINDVSYVPGLAHNLLTVGQLLEKGCLIVFKDKQCISYDKDDHSKIIAKTNMLQNRIFSFNLPCEASTTLNVAYDDSSWLWHIRYGHLNMKGLKLLYNKQMVKGLPLIGSIDKVCEGCILGKQHRDSFPVGKSWRASKPLELVHADICGPMQTLSLNKNKYFIVFVDDFSRRTWVYFIKKKSDAFVIFQQFKALVEKQSGYFLKTLCIDRGGEFTSNKFDSYCKMNGVQRQLTASYTPQ